MNSPTLCILGLLCFWLFVSTQVVSGSVQYKGQSIVGFHTRGRVVCSLSANPPTNSPGIGGVKVNITCNGGSITLGSFLTDPRGFFDGLATAIDGISTDNSQLPCVATATLPPNLSCSVFPPIATLRAALDLLGTIVQLAIGLVAEVTTTVFTLV